MPTYILLFAKQEDMVIRMCLGLNKVRKVKLGRTEFFPFQLEKNNRPGAEKEMVEAPGSNACNRPLLDVRN